MTNTSINRGIAFLDEKASKQKSAFLIPEPITHGEWVKARSTPDCIVENFLYADISVRIAPGGMGKTTLLLFETIHIVLGVSLYGLKVLKPGPVVIITAEDTREMLIARLREIAKSMKLKEEDIATVMKKVHISDVAGNGFKLTEIKSDMVKPSDSVDQIIEACKTIGPVLIVIDPAVSFGVGESRVNDAEQGLIESGRKLRRALNCAVQYIHHTGKQNARDKATDQYSGRGGSAFADGARMVHVLQSMTPSEWRDETSSELEKDESGLRLARPKMSYCAPQSDILIRRKGHSFMHVRRVAQSKQEKIEAAANKVFELLTSELNQGRYHSMNSLGSLDSGLKRDVLRDAVNMLQVSCRIESRKIPNAAKGGKHTYLHPISSPTKDGEPIEKIDENSVPLASEQIIIASPPSIGNSPAANLPPPEELSFPYGSPNINGEPTANLANQWTG